jgi:hypothetical protein
MLLRLRRLPSASEDINIRPVILILTFVSAFVGAFVACAAHAERGSAVFGSFASETQAHVLQKAIEVDLQVDARLVSALVNGQRYHRVMSEESIESFAREIVEIARRRGYSAWFLAADPRVADERPAPTIARPAAPRRSPAPRRADVSTAPASSGAPIGGDDVGPTLVDQRPPVTWGARLKATTNPQTRSETRPSAGAAGASQPALSNTGASEHITVQRFDDLDIEIDGMLSEPVWQAVPGYTNMLVTEPITLEPARHLTTSRFVATARGLYVGATMEQPADTLISRLSARDEYLNRDAYGITIDTSGEGNYGYWFIVNLGGSVQDGKVAPERSFTTEWDGPWISDTAITADGWSVEMFLPWSMMTMPADADERTMGFWVNRKVAYTDERYGWPALPFTAPRFMSALNTMGLPKVQPKQQWAVFPYLTAVNDGILDQSDGKAGAELFWRPTTNLQVTAALNPDFGAVESDDVVVNLTAFETFFAEKRLFFLEGNEVFVSTPRANPQSGSSRGSGGRRAPSTFSREPITLMNTRRVGGAPRHVTIPDGITVDGVERSKPTDLLGAVKVVGQTGNLRYGTLAAFEDEVDLRGTLDATGEQVRVRAPGRDFGVVRALYEADTKGRRSIGYLGTVVDKSIDTATVHGIDTHFQTGNGELTWDAQTLYSSVDGISGGGILNDFRYVSKGGIFQSLSVDYLDKKVNIGDFGFIRRNDEMSFNYNIFGQRGRDLPTWLRQRRQGVFATGAANTDGLVTRAALSAFVVWTLADNSDVRMFWNFYAATWDDRNSRGNGIYKTDERLTGSFSYGTDSARPFSYSVQVGFEGEDTGDVSYSGDIGFTYSPTANMSIDLDFTYRRRDEWLLHTGDANFTTFDATNLQTNLAIDYFITARQQLRLTLQWVGIEAKEQRFFQVPAIRGDLYAHMKDPLDDVDDFTISRLTAQLRYRWQLGPLSDLFVVYTRGSNLPNRTSEDFEDLFTDALSDPIVDVLVVKLRYRFGS